MRIVVTGKMGQVARSLAERQASWPRMKLTFLARPRFDLSEPQVICEEIGRLKPDAVISAAAYTAVDQAEEELENAYAHNTEAPGKLAMTTAELGIPIIHLSTDYVFAGTGYNELDEREATSPTSVYGRSKLAGEERVMSGNPRHVILRSAWVYSPFGKNFVKTMLALAEDADELRVVDDQRGVPTSALDIADGLFLVITRLNNLLESEAPYGLYHMAGAETASWFEFAQEIMRQSKALGGPSAKVIPVSSSAYPTKARRPSNSQLNSAKFRDQYGDGPAGFKTALADIILRILEDNQRKTARP